MKKINLLSIDEEASLCRKAFKDIAVGAVVMHCHHEKWLEILAYPAENRISYILASKSQHEQAMRLHCFRPAPRKLLADAKWQEAYAKWQEAYAKWQEAYAKREEAYAKWQEAYAKLSPLHPKFCACKWGKTTDIFGGER